MKTFLVIALSVVLLLVIIVTATLIKNHARFFEPPGLFDRLSVYLGQHTAATLDNHPFPELRTPVFLVGPERLYTIVIDAATELGWQIKQEDYDNFEVSLVITTPVFSFKDDLVAQVKLINPELTSAESGLYVRSSSQTGKADFAANAGHIQQLVQRVRQKLKEGC